MNPGANFTKFILTLLITVSTVWEVCAQQDGQYTQFVFTQSSFNPAYNGTQDALSVNAIYRGQWIGIEGSPQSQSLTAHLPIYKLSSGIGINVSNDILGAERSTRATLAYSYHIYMKRGLLSIGAEAGIIQRGLKGADLRAPDGDYQEVVINHNDEFIPVGTVNDLVPDFGAGIYYTDRKLEVGLSVTHLVNPIIQYPVKDVISEIEIVRHYYLIASYKIKVGSSLHIKPSVLYRTDFGDNMIDLKTILFFKDNFWGGVSFRTYFNNKTDAVNVMAGMNINRQFSLGYAYDFTLSSLKSVSTGSHEVMLGYKLPMNKPRVGKQINNLRFLYY